MKLLKPKVVVKYRQHDKYPQPVRFKKVTVDEIKAWPQTKRQFFIEVMQPSLLVDIDGACDILEIDGVSLEHKTANELITFCVEYFGIEPETKVRHD